MDYDELVTKVIELLQREKRVPYRALKRRFDLDDEYIFYITPFSASMQSSC